MATANRATLSWGDWVLAGLAVLILAMAAGGTLGTHLSTVVQRLQQLGSTGTSGAGSSASSPAPAPQSTVSPFKQTAPSSNTSSSSSTSPASSKTAASGPQAAPSFLQHGLIQITPTQAMAAKYAAATNFYSGNWFVRLGQHLFDALSSRAQKRNPGLPRETGIEPPPPAPGQAETWAQWLWYGPTPPPL
ncbi:MAG: hypothetical protein ACP5QO_09685 [Clostridia bacterium]